MLIVILVVIDNDLTRKDMELVVKRLQKEVKTLMAWQTLLLGSDLFYLCYI